MYKITKWFLIIYVENKEDFFQEYDKAIKEIPDTAFNKRWYRSIKRTFCGSEYGVCKFIIGLNHPTLKKLL